MNYCRGSNATEGRNCREQPFETLLRAVKGHAFWEARLRGLCTDKRTAFSLHLAVLLEPYLGYVLEGRKTVESRFSAVRCPPYRRVQSGDVVLLKSSGGPVEGI